MKIKKMPYTVAVNLFLNESNSNDESECIRRKSLRDCSDPLSLPEETFMKYFRLSKEGFIIVLNKIGEMSTGSTIPLTIQLAATLKFFVEGCIKRSVGNEVMIGMPRTTFSKCFSKMLCLLERKFCPVLIKFNTAEADLKASKHFFYENYGIPGIIGCIDGTHVPIKGPQVEEHLFFNRKRYFSINAMIICDYKMNITAVDATRPGSSDDSFVFSTSAARNFFMDKYESGERGCWLLADSGYPVEPFLMTPYRNATGISQQIFNQRHASARNVVGRTIRVLKSRFQCLSRTLWYSPLKSVQIINVCCALHNLCNKLKLEQPEYIREEHVNDESDERNEFDHTDTSITNTVNIIRDSIAESLS